jgi:hypothetical protein
LFYTGVIRQYGEVYFYKKQGIPFVGTVYPIFGNLPMIMKIKKEFDRKGISSNPIIEIGSQAFNDDPPKIYGFVFYK